MTTSFLGHGKSKIISVVTFPSKVRFYLCKIIEDVRFIYKGGLGQKIGLKGRKV